MTADISLTCQTEEFVYKFMHHADRFVFQRCYLLLNSGWLLCWWTVYRYLSEIWLNLFIDVKALIVFVADRNTVCRHCATTYLWALFQSISYYWLDWSLWKKRFLICCRLGNIWESSVLIFITMIKSGLSWSRAFEWHRWAHYVASILILQRSLAILNGSNLRGRTETSCIYWKQIRFIVVIGLHLTDYNYKNIN
jgi:hypothetical protein